MKGKLLFSETQHFKNTIFWWIEVSVGLITLGGLAYGISINLSPGEDWVNTPVGNPTNIIAATITAIVLGGVHWLFTTMKLIVVIDSDNLYYSYYPFVRSKKQLRKNDLKQVEVRKYNPILEYGGWGYRISARNGKAYNMKGSYGLQLVFNNGDRLLIGTQKPEELKRAIDQLKDNWNQH